MENDVINYKTAAQFLGVPVGTVYSLVCRKQIPHIRLGRRFVRFKRQDLLKWLDSHQVNALKETDWKLIQPEVRHD
jgi:excisionase family DNA binding protein